MVSFICYGMKMKHYLLIYYKDVTIAYYLHLKSLFELYVCNLLIVYTKIQKKFKNYVNSIKSLKLCKP